MRKKDNHFCRKKNFSVVSNRYCSFFFFLLTTLLSCRSSTDAPLEVTRAFYHWQTQLNLTEEEQAYLKASETNRLYVKFFDIDWDATRAEPIPLAILRVDTLSALSTEIIPTVFITNRSLLQLPESAIESLALRIYKLLMQLCEQFPNTQFPGIQIDCDWSGQSKDKYFKLLQVLRRQAMTPDMELSVTIRLHQLKYPKQTGVPPADRGMLMFYNMGEVTDWNEPNSILNLSTAAAYLSSRNNYPLALDLALPLFHWGVLFREGQMIKLINGLTDKDLQDTSRFQIQDSTHFRVIKSTYLDGYYLYTGDVLRLEYITPADLSAAVQMLKPFFPRKSFTLAYYHLDTPILKRFPHAVLSKLAEQFEMEE